MKLMHIILLVVLFPLDDFYSCEVPPWHICKNFIYNRPQELKQFLRLDLQFEFFEDYPTQHGIKAKRRLIVVIYIYLTYKVCILN